MAISGQVSISIKGLADRWKWSQGKVKRFLDNLKNGEQIEYQTTNVTTIITILNYDQYQGDGEQTELQTESKRRANGEQTESKRRANGDNIRIEEIKEGKESKEMVVCSEEGDQIIPIEYKGKRYGTVPSWNYVESDVLAKCNYINNKMKQAGRPIVNAETTATTEANRSLLLKVCWLVVGGFCSEDWLMSAVNGTATVDGVNNPAAYFKTCLTETMENEIPLNAALACLEGHLPQLRLKPWINKGSNNEQVA